MFKLFKVSVSVLALLSVCDVTAFGNRKQRRRLSANRWASRIHGLIDSKALAAAHEVDKRRNRDLEWTGAYDSLIGNAVDSASEFTGGDYTDLINGVLGDTSGSIFDSLLNGTDSSNSFPDQLSNLTEGIIDSIFNGSNSTSDLLTDIYDFVDDYLNGTNSSENWFANITDIIYNIFDMNDFLGANTTDFNFEGVNMSSTDDAIVSTLLNATLDILESFGPFIFGSCDDSQCSPTCARLLDQYQCLCQDQPQEQGATQMTKASLYCEGNCVYCDNLSPTPTCALSSFTDLTSINPEFMSNPNASALTGTFEFCIQNTPDSRLQGKVCFLADAAFDSDLTALQVTATGYDCTNEVATCTDGTVGVNTVCTSTDGSQSDVTIDGCWDTKPVFPEDSVFYLLSDNYTYSTSDCIPYTPNLSTFPPSSDSTGTSSGTSASASPTTKATTAPTPSLRATASPSATTQDAAAAALTSDTSSSASRAPSMEHSAMTMVLAFVGTALSLVAL